jgi:hypothetical protein
MATCLFVSPCAARLAILALACRGVSRSGGANHGEAERSEKVCRAAYSSVRLTFGDSAPPMGLFAVQQSDPGGVEGPGRRCQLAGSRQNKREGRLRPRLPLFTEGSFGTRSRRCLLAVPFAHVLGHPPAGLCVQQLRPGPGRP